MSQLQKGTNYTATGTSSFVTHTNLNAHVDNARLVGGAIDEQESNSISEDNDLVLINKGGQLYKQTKSEFTNEINSNLINTNTVNAGLVEVDDVEINDTLLVGGTTSLVGPTTVDGNITVNSTSNLKGEVQYNGTPVYGLASFQETNVVYGLCNSTTQTGKDTTCNQWLVNVSLTSLTKTNKEIWIIEADFPIIQFDGSPARFDLFRQGTSSSLAMQTNYPQMGTLGAYAHQQIKLSCVIPDSVTFTNETISLRYRYDSGVVHPSYILQIGYGGSMTFPEITRVVRLTKYIKP